jgi:hypothetical protein
MWDAAKVMLTLAGSTKFCSDAACAAFDCTAELVDVSMRTTAVFRYGEQLRVSKASLLAWDWWLMMQSSGEEPSKALLIDERPYEMCKSRRLQSERTEDRVLLR